jgi:membrane-bound ClpP family serine protease
VYSGLEYDSESDRFAKHASSIRSGKADFDGQLVDVIAEGLPIDRGQAIVVTKARGSRVLVRAVEQS